MLENTGSKRTSIRNMLNPGGIEVAMLYGTVILGLPLFVVGATFGQEKKGVVKWVDVERMLGFADIDPEQPSKRLPGK